MFALSGEGVLVGFPADQAELIRSQVDAYWAVPWQHSLLGAWERISALLFHLGASVFVYKSVHEKHGSSGPGLSAPEVSGKESWIRLPRQRSSCLYR